ADGIRDRTVTGVQTCALPIYAAVQLSRLCFLPQLFERPTQPVQHAEPLLIARCRQVQPAPQDRLRHDVGTFLEEAHAQGFRRARSEERRVGEDWRWWRLHGQ